MEHVTLLYYKYITIDNPKQLMDDQRNLCESLDLKGRIIVAHEGINGTVEGTKENTEAYIKEMSKDSRFNDIHWKKSISPGDSFPRLSVKVRPEIVSLHLKDEDFSPREVTGNRLSPDELKQWYDHNEDFVIVDMRNDYELEVGKFDKTIFPGMKNFRDLPRQLKEIEDVKNKKVLTVCTGGVRCEKASGYLKQKGFDNVYQLDGGIVSFMEKYPNSNFRGSLYVFDKRKTMHFDDPDKHEVIGRCMRCDTPCETYENCAHTECNRHFVCCADCAHGKPFCSYTCKVRTFLKYVTKPIRTFVT